MEIRVLRYFLAIAREGSITNAANVLHVTQPTLSRQIHDLEDELHHKLFVRGSHSMTLTYEGELLKKRAEEILALTEKTIAQFNSLEQEITGDIYIGGGETPALRGVCEVACALRAQHPHLHYHLFSGNSEDVRERLDKGLLDFGILLEPADIAKYDFLRLPAKDRWGVIMRHDSPLAAKDSIVKEDLLELPLICSRQALYDDPKANAFTAWFGSDLEKLNIVTTFNLVYNAALMVEAGMGYAVTIEKIADTSPSSALCFRPLEPKFESGLLLIWKKGQVFSKGAELFLALLRERLSASGRN